MNDREVQVQGSGNASSEDSLLSFISKKKGGDEELRNEDGERKRHIVAVMNCLTERYYNARVY